jgi:hypothetical protein
MMGHLQFSFPLIAAPLRVLGSLFTRNVCEAPVARIATGAFQLIKTRAARPQQCAEFFSLMPFV